MLASSLDTPSAPARSPRTRRIAQTEWPTIVSRYTEGETISAIARDYGVTAPAIRYILKKADAVPSKPAATAPSPAQAEAPAAEAVADEPAKPAEPERFDSPLAQRLAEASRSCSLALEALYGGDGGTDEVESAMHQVRRALAAIEIDMSRQTPSAQAQRREAGPAPAAASERSDGPSGGGRAAATPLDLRELDAGGAGEVEGTVKFFSAEKGFGFVTPYDGGKDVFVHIRAVERSGLTTLEPEQAVRVTTTRGQKGLQAETVTLL